MPFCMQLAIIGIRVSFLLSLASVFLLLKDLSAISLYRQVNESVSPLQSLITGDNSEENTERDAIAAACAAAVPAARSVNPLVQKHI